MKLLLISKKTGVFGMEKVKTKRLGELLLDFNYITPKQLEEAIKHQLKTNKRLGEVLVELNYVSLMT